MVHHYINGGHKTFDLQYFCRASSQQVNSIENYNRENLRKFAGKFWKILRRLNFPQFFVDP